MEPHSYALLQRVHGYLGLLGLALLLHPVLRLRTPGPVGRWTRRTAELSAGLLLAPFLLGLWLYADYRAHVKPALWQAAPQTVLAFEVKEHLAFFAVVLALAGALALRPGGGEPGRRVARTLLAVGALCAAITVVLGMVVASAAHGAW